MVNLLLFMFAYFIGVGSSAYVFHPMRNWQEGYNTAKEYYRDWDRGFNDGFKSASTAFQNYYDKGFDDGFEAGRNSALTQKGAQE